MSGARSSRILGSTEGKRVRIAVLSTVVVFGGLALLIVRSPGWSEPNGVRDQFFNWPVLVDGLPKIAEKFGTNVAMFLLAEAIILVLGLAIAVLRSLPGPLFTPVRLLATAYADFFRGVPTLLVIALLGYGMPALDLRGVPNSDFFWAIVALSLVYAAYVSEVYRAGIQSIHPSQVAAARSLGLGRWQATRYVVLPQAVRRVVPPLLNDFIGLQKDTALVAFLGVTEALRQAQILQASLFNFTPYVALAIVFVVITIPQARFVDWLIARDQARRLAGGDG
ncbi:MAG: amino acid ABC transporter permease [Actinomycetota bacterium]